MEPFGYSVSILKRYEYTDDLPLPATATHSCGDVLRDKTKPGEFPRDEEDYGRDGKLRKFISTGAGCKSTTILVKST